MPYRDFTSNVGISYTGQPRILCFDLLRYRQPKIPQHISSPVLYNFVAVSPRVAAVVASIMVNYTINISQKIYQRE